MQNTALTQALIRLVVIFVTAGLGALGANLTILQDAVTDPIFASTIVAVITALISAVLKYLGGATVQAPDRGVRGAGEGATKNPNPLAI